MLTDRREHCEYIKSCLNDRGINEVGLYLGGMTEKELNSSNEQKIILATYSMAAEGYDNPKLDTLIMATGRSNIEQSCGRVLRRKNANNPLIIDIVDSEYLNNQYITRRKFYKKKNYVLNSSLKNSKERVEDDEEDECMF
jgi:superfamily II DNA or RNA helicase